MKTATEIDPALRKRLRLICEWFAKLNERTHSKNFYNGLSPEVIAEIEAQEFDPADLMAIRDTPHRWTLGDPYLWLWLLHRYQNH